MSKVFCLLVVALAIHMLSSVIPIAQYQASRPSPGTTKNLHLTTLSLCLSQIEQMLYCSMFKLFYVFRITKLFYVAHNDSVYFGNRLLNILNGIKLPSVLESIFICNFSSSLPSTTF